MGKELKLTTLYDFSGGMESAAMLVVDRERIRKIGAIVRWADTGKQFPEMADSIKEIETALGLSIFPVPRRITFDEFLFERGGMVRKGTNDCSRRMKRANLMRHMKSLPPPYEINLGFNADEEERADEFTKLNEREWCHWRYPLIEADVTRAASVEICERAGFSVLVSMYKKMGRFDCFWCGNQKPSQALKVAKHYPELAKEWMEAEAKKGHSFMPIPLKVLVNEENSLPLFQEQGHVECSCFGGTNSVLEEDESDGKDAP